MKIVMTLLVRDEEDILRENIEYHLNQGVDFIIATDNLSVDSTKDILKYYEKKNLLKYIFEATDNYNQHEWVTTMARLACVAYQADWVINNDADEFWWPTSHATIREAISSLSKSWNIIEANRTNYVCLQDLESGIPFYEQMVFREKHSLNAKGAPLPPKRAHKGVADIKVEQGNHDVQGFPVKKIANNLLEIFHYPIRTKKQLINKIIKGGQAYQNNSELPVNFGSTWRQLFSEYEENGLVQYLDENVYSKEKIEIGLESGGLVRDERLANYLRGVF